jgi:hypothetical protein
MLTDRGVRISDTPIAGRRIYLKNMLTDRGGQHFSHPYCWPEKISKKYAKLIGVTEKISKKNMLTDNAYQLAYF